MKRFGCTDSLLMLPISGAFLALLGIVLIILYTVARGLTVSLHYIEGAVPTYVAAVVLILTGAIMMILFKKRPHLLICFAMVVNCATFCLSTLQAISVGIVSIPYLHSFSACVYHNSLSECQCYIISARQNSTGIIVPGADSEKVTFQAVRSCAVIEHNMIDCLYILCIIYGFAGITSLITGSMSFMLMCFQRRATKEANAFQVAASSRRGQGHTSGRAQSSASGTEGTNLSRAGTSGCAAASTTTANNTALGRRATIGHQDVRTDPPHLIGRPSNTNGTHGRQHTSGGATSTAQQTSGSQRQSRPPALIRGGYLQIHVSGPSIPVYIVPGNSNQAFIALTDLPSLQLPSLDSVPAFVSDVSELYPPDQPPPYSPTPNEHPPSISVILESPTTSASGNRTAPSQRSEVNEENPTVQSDQHVHSENPAMECVLHDEDMGPVPTECTGVQDDVVQAEPISGCPNQTGQSPQQFLISGSSEEVASSQEIGSDFQQSQQHSSEGCRDMYERMDAAIVSSGTDSSTLTCEPSSAQPGMSQSRATRDDEEIDQSLPQSAKPKHSERLLSKKEANQIDATRGSSTQRMSSPHRHSSPGRSVSRSIRKATKSSEISEHTSGQSFHTKGKAARVRSNSKGRQRQLPDISPINDCSADSIARYVSDSQQQPDEITTNRAKPNQKKQLHQSRMQKTVDPMTQALSNMEADHQSHPKGANNTHEQPSKRPTSQGRRNISNAKKSSTKKDNGHRKKSVGPTSGCGKIEMTFPCNQNSSSNESLSNIITLVESVHSSAKIKPQVNRPHVNLEKIKLLDSRV